MLTIFRRHSKTCGKSSRRYRRCRCPIHVAGSLGGETIRKSLDLVSWEAAENLIHEWNRSGKIGGKEHRAVTLVMAVETFIEDARGRQLASESIRLYQGFLTRKLLPWALAKGLSLVGELGFEEMVEFRASWKFKPVTAAKRFELLRHFFTFCVAANWTAKNPLVGMKRPEVRQNPTLPFLEEEVGAILEAATRFNPRGTHGKNQPKRIRAFVLLLRYSGLRIGDAVRLTKSQLVDRRVFLYTQKTGTPVYLPLPDFVSQAVEEQAKLNTHPLYVFWSGKGSARTATSSWQRTLKRVFEMAKVKGGHAHRLRDSAAVSWLLGGLGIEDVAVLLGNSPKIVHRHYSPWILARQNRLEEMVRKTWETPEPRLRAVS